jgi:predicted nucleotidyltransferase
MSAAPAFDRLLPVLVEAGVEFILVGGLAGVVHGAARLTYDVDLVYARSRANYEHIIAALSPHQPYLRDAPPGLPFSLDISTLRNGLNFTLTTALGDIDLLGEIAGGGTYENLLPHCQPIEAFGVTFQCVNLPKLIELKRAAGRPKDFEAIAELETLMEEES